MSAILTIQRSKWRRGGGDDTHPDGPTRLLNDLGRMCCLGFDALGCGFAPADILNVVDPSDIGADPARFTDYMSRRIDECVWHHLTESTKRAIAHNDDLELDEPERERLIREDLIALGWDDVVFVD